MVAKKKESPALDYIIDQLRPLAVKIKDLKQDDRNARIHPDRNLSAIKASLLTYKQRKPIVVNSTTGAVEAGNGTLQAAIDLGWEYIAAVFVQDDPTTAKGFAITDNRTSELAGWDSDMLSTILKELESDSVDVFSLGWSVEDLRKYVDNTVFDTNALTDIPVTESETSFLIYVAFPDKESFIAALDMLSGGVRKSVQEGSRMASLDGVEMMQCLKKKTSKHA